MDKKIALSIAGSDPSSGAGVQADLKSFSYLNVHGTTAITCITSQNTKYVKKIHRLPIDIIESQIDTLYDDFKIDAVKTGMLFDEEIIKLVLKKINQYKMSPIVDPVMVATSGDTLIDKNYIKSLIKNILPKTYILTANIPEAYAITNINIESVSDVKTAIKKLYDFGPKYVLLKGGHLETSESVDILYDGKKNYEFKLPKIKNRKAHGSGCSLSALIAGYIALGLKPIEAVNRAKHVIWSMINEGYSPGKGFDVLNHFCKNALPINLTNQKIEIWIELKNSIDKLISFLQSDFIPEVGMNFAYAKDNAESYEDICSIDGRIYKTKDKIKCYNNLDFGVSKHVSSIILAAMSFDKSYRSAINIKYSKENLKLCKKADFKIGTFNRKYEPSDIKSTMEWGTKNAISKLGYIPDVIYDLGDVGKEPMIRIIGKNPKDVLIKLEKMVKSDI